jgi:hypothetical protein
MMSGSLCLRWNRRWVATWCFHSSNRVSQRWLGVLGTSRIFYSRKIRRPPWSFKPESRGLRCELSCVLTLRKRKISLLQPGRMDRSSYADDINCLIIVSSLRFVYRKVQISMHLLVSVRTGKTPKNQQCDLGFFKKN